MIIIPTNPLFSAARRRRTIRNESKKKNYNYDAVPAAKVGMHLYALAVPEDTIGGRAFARQLEQQKAVENKS